MVVVCKPSPPPSHRTMHFMGGQRGGYLKVNKGFQNFAYEFRGLGEIFGTTEHNMCQACKDEGSEDPIGLRINS